MFRWLRDRGSMNLELILLVSFLALTATATLFSLGDGIMCLYANEAATAGAQEYPGRCVEIRKLVAVDNGDRTVTLTWVGGEAPFTFHRSNDELMAFRAPAGIDVAYAADGELVQDLDGNPNDRTATVEALPGLAYYKVTELKGSAVVADLRTSGGWVVRVLSFKDAVSGQPLAGLRVEDVASVRVGGLPLFSSNVVTDSQGRVFLRQFEADAAPDYQTGSWTASATVLGCAPVSATGPSVGLGVESEAVFVLPRPQLVDLTVRGPDMVGLPSGAVTLAGETYSADAAGNVSVRRFLAGGDYQVVFSAPGYLSQAVTYTLSAANPRLPDSPVFGKTVLRYGSRNLVPEATVALTVRDPYGTPLVGATVALGDGTATRTAATDAFGVASFSQLAAGSYTAAASMADYVTGTRAVSLVAGQSYAGTLALDTSVGVKVLDSWGRAVSGLTVGLGSRSALTNASGWAYLPLAVGTYSGTVSVAGYAVVPVTVSPNGTVLATTVVNLVPVNPGSISITATKPGGAPFSARDWAVISAGATVASGKTNASGKATVSNVPAGSYTVRVGVSTTQAAVVTAGNTTSLTFLNLVN